MMGSWPVKKIEELCEVTSSKRIYAKELVRSGVPFLKSKEIIEKVNGNDKHANSLFISEERYQQIIANSGALAEGDVLLTSRGTLGVPYVVRATDRFHFADGNLTWFRNFRGLNSKFLRYWFLSSMGKAQLQTAVIGAAQQAYTIASLKKMEMRQPSLVEQNRVVSILSTYDDLIENNTRRIAILEEMARRLYEEWFVHFRFPGHEDATFTETDGALVPAGWEYRRFDDLVDFVKASTSSGGHLSDREYVPIDCIGRLTLALQETKPWTEAQSSLILFEENDILFGAMRPYFHKVAIAPFSGVTRSTCFVLRSKMHRGWAFAVLTAFREETIAYASAHSKGATIPYAVWEGSLDKLEILTPTDNLLEDFERLVGPMLLWIKTQFRKTANLRVQRDLLLPKLVSGEIDVSEAKETLEEAVA